MAETDLSWTEKEPSLQNPEEAKKAREILDRPHSVPRGHETLDDLKPVHKEEYSPTPTALDTEYLWVIPCLAYCMVGMDRSVFELYSWAKDAAVEVKTYQTDQPLMDFNGVDVSGNRWFHTIQGLPKALGTEFCDYIETYQLNGPTISWQLQAYRTRLADPFVRGERQGVDAVILLPHALNSGVHVKVIKPVGLDLSKPSLGMVRE